MFSYVFSLSENIFNNPCIYTYKYIYKDEKKDIYIYIYIYKNEQKWLDKK